jgi:sugar phosphate isomerase/epimerase
VAVETGSGDPQTLAGLLREVNSSTLGAAYDPASLLVEGYDPLSGIDPLADRIFIARVRDAIAGSERRPGREVNVGEGQVDLAEYLASLDQAGYNRAALIRRTSSDRPIQDIAAARERLRRLVGK